MNFGHLLPYWQMRFKEEGYDVQALSHYYVRSYNFARGEEFFPAELFEWVRQHLPEFFEGFKNPSEMRCFQCGSSAAGRDGSTLPEEHPRYRGKSLR